MLFVRDFLADQRIFRSPGAPERPVVSVILPTWRRREGGLLQRAIESVLAQGFGDLELIVVDDGSTDGTADLLAEMQAADPRLVHVRHELNCGLPALRVNEGIELARGRFVAFQFDDDEWLEGALEALVAGAREAAEPALVCGGSLLVGPGDEERELPGIEVNLLTLSFQNRIANNAALLPRAAFEICGL
ncbi:MAG TPA: glycosyltransferase family 2 protein, partial [Thermoanaerobaculia bacterium]